MSTANPCSCIGTAISTPITPPCPPDAENCLVLCDIVVLAKNGVGPCGQVGTINVADDDLYGHDFSACESNALAWSVVNVTGPVVSATITVDGQLTWVTGGPETVGQYATITLYACCGELSSYMVVLIGVKDECDCPECDPCENCDPCTGDCLDAIAEISIGGLET